MKKNAWKKIFNTIVPHIPHTDFAAFLEWRFGLRATRKVLDAFEELGLPAPESNDEFLKGTEGALVFLNRYGVVLRIEIEDTRWAKLRHDRIDNSPWVLAPLGVIAAGAARIEICPGCHTADGDDLRVLRADQDVRRRLYATGVDYWDQGPRNVGLLPAKSPLFPDGIPVVIDRGAVRQLTEAVAPVRKALKMEARETEKVRERLYGPLIRCFKEGSPAAFWQLCRAGVEKGTLVAGWNDLPPGSRNRKQAIALETAAVYEARLQAGEEKAAAAGLTPRAARYPLSLHR